jgi:hypothetical protein
MTYTHWLSAGFFDRAGIFQVPLSIDGGFLHFGFLAFSL